jgi:ABC-type phosphate/phosphonate transport system ATPase subunit
MFYEYIFYFHAVVKLHRLQQFFQQPQNLLYNTNIINIRSYEMHYTQTLYLIRGVSGAGKSNLAHCMYSSGMVSTVCEADDYFYDENDNYKFDASQLRKAHQECRHLALDALLDGQSVAVSNTSTTEDEVEIYRKIAFHTNSKFVSIIVENRNDTKNTHGVPDEVIEKQRKRFSVTL